MTNKILKQLHIAYLLRPIKFKPKGDGEWVSYPANTRVRINLDTYLAYIGVYTVYLEWDDYRLMC